MSTPGWTTVSIPSQPSASLVDQAHELVAITRLSFDDALRAASTGSRYAASFVSGLEFCHFVTPRELAAWLKVNHPSAIDCDRGVHYYPTEQLGQCVTCGTYLQVQYTWDGDTYDAEIDEDTFLEECAAVGMYYRWAPPLTHLDGMTQAEYVQDAGRAEAFDPWA